MERSTLQVKKRIGSYPRVRIEGGGRAVVSQAGGVLLVETVRKAGLDTAISAALTPWRKPRGVHDPGKILLDGGELAGSSPVDRGKRIPICMSCPTRTGCSYASDVAPRPGALAERGSHRRRAARAVLGGAAWASSDLDLHAVYDNAQAVRGGCAMAVDLSAARGLRSELDSKVPPLCVLGPHGSSNLHGRRAVAPPAPFASPNSRSLSPVPITLLISTVLEVAPWST